MSDRQIKGTPWKPEMDPILRQLWSDAYSSVEIAAILTKQFKTTITDFQVRNHRGLMLDLPDHRTGKRPSEKEAERKARRHVWTQPQVDQLKRLWALRTPIAQIALVLGLDLKVVRNKREDLKLPARKREAGVPSAELRIWVRPDLAERVDEIAAELKTTRSGWVALLIERELGRHRRTA